MRKFVISMVLLLMFSVVPAAVWAASGPIYFGEVKKGTYSPLKYGALTINSPLDGGGYSIAKGKVVDDPNEADFVINTFSDLGARGIAAATGTINDPLKAAPLQMRDHAYFEAGKLFTIMLHDGSYAKLQIDRVSSALVTFSYALEVQAPASSASDSQTPPQKNGNTNPASGGSATTVTPSTGTSAGTPDFPGAVNVGTDSVKPGSKQVDREIHMKIGAASATIDGSTVTLDSVPVIVEGYTMVPLRFIAEGLGAQVTWNDQTSSASLLLNGKTIVVYTNNKIALVDRKEVGMPLPPTIIKERLMVPLRFVSENFGLQIDFNQADYSIHIKGKIMAVPDAGTAGGAAAAGGSSNGAIVNKGSGLELDAQTKGVLNKPFKLRVPGAVIFDNGLGVGGVISAGASTQSVVTIREDGTYTWTNPYSGEDIITGVWEETGDASYFLVLRKAERGKDYYLAYADKNTWGGGNVILWDRDAFSYNGDFVK